MRRTGIPSTVAALAAILALAGVLRFARLDRQGLLFFDEGQLILEARGAGALAFTFGATVAGRPGAAERLAAEIRNGRIAFGKPAHNLLLALLLPSSRRADRATLVLSAMAGTLTVLCVWLLARAWYGDGVALLAALLLAVSPYHLLYSREGLSDALTVMFWTGALAVFARPGIRPALGSGALAGLAVATNYRVLFLPALFAWLLWRDPGTRATPRMRRAAAWMAGFVLPLLAFEGAYQLVLATAGGGGVRFPAGTYFGQLAELLSFHGSQGFRFGGWLAFGHYVWRWEGAVSLVIMIAVLPWQLARWRNADGALNAALLAPWLLYSAYWDNASRFFTLLLPLVAIAKARWLAAAGGWAAGVLRLPAPALKPVLPLVAAVLLLRPAVALVPRPTPYLEAAEFLARSADPRHLSTNPRLGNAYFTEGVATQFPLTDSEVEKLGRTGFRWAVTDIQAFFGGVDQPEARLTTAVRTVRGASPVLEVEYGPVALAQFVLEQDLAFDEARALLAQVESPGPRLHVFDLAAADGRRRR